MSVVWAVPGPATARRRKRRAPRVSNSGENAASRRRPSDARSRAGSRETVVGHAIFRARGKAIYPEGGRFDHDPVDARYGAGPTIRRCSRAARDAAVMAGGRFVMRRYWLFKSDPDDVRSGGPGAEPRPDDLLGRRPQLPGEEHAARRSARGRRRAVLPLPDQAARRWSPRRRWCVPGYPDPTQFDPAERGHDPGSPPGRSSLVRRGHPAG